MIYDIIQVVESRSSATPYSLRRYVVLTNACCQNKYAHRNNALCCWSVHVQGYHMHTMSVNQKRFNPDVYPVMRWSLPGLSTDACHVTVDVYEARKKFPR